MTYSTLTNTINDAFDARDSITQDTIGEVRDAVEEALRLLDRGEVRVAETTGNHGYLLSPQPSLLLYQVILEPPLPHLLPRQ